MADNVYLYETILNSLTDDGTGNDWLILTGDYGGSLASPGAFIALSAFLEPTHLGSIDYAYAFPASHVWAPAFLYGGIENAMGGAGSEQILGSNAANILQGDPGDVAGGADNLQGFAGDDTLLGMGGGDLLFGGEGNDHLYGDNDPNQQGGNIAAGDDSLDGGSGEDTLAGGLGHNTLTGGDGYQDTADYAGFFDDLGNYTFRLVLDLEQGSATVLQRDAFDSSETIAATDSLSGIEAAIGTNGDDLMTGRNSFAPTDFHGDFLYGGLGRDSLHGGTGGDNLYGGEDGDYLWDGGNALPLGGPVDLLSGGNGNDTYFVTSDRTAFFESSTGGNDTVFAAINLTLAANVEQLRLSPGQTAALIGTGNALNNQLVGNEYANKLYGLSGDDLAYGGTGNDLLIGGSGADMLYGGTEADTLLGGTQGDQLFGGTQNDSLQGGTGRDTLTGGGNADTFTFTSAADSAVGSQRDLITDFRSGTDHIDLHRIARTQTFIGKDKFDGFGTAEIRYDKSAGILSGDADGDGTVDWQVSLGAGAVLLANDLIL